MTNPTHLYLSYAVEDLALAQWLARKLTAQGYAVWFDKMKMLGGEPWPHAVDDAISQHSFRMLALISGHSLKKKKPAAEWGLAKRIGKQRHVPDFIIPLTADDSEPDESLSPAPSISFAYGWAEGWRTLMAKLESLKTPRPLSNGGPLAAASFSFGAGLKKESEELLFANIIRVTALPKVIKVFQIGNLETGDRKLLEADWTFYEMALDALLAFAPPPPEFADRIRATPEELPWAEGGVFRKVPVRELAGRLILRALGRRLINAGCLRHPDPKWSETFFLPEAFVEGGQLESLGFGGRKVRIPIKGRISFRRSGGISEVNIHYFGFRLKIARGLDNAFYIQLNPTLVFFDESGEPVADKSVQARLKRVTETWDNEECLNRIMAVEHVLSGAPLMGLNEPTLEAGLFTASAPMGVQESVSEPRAAGAEAAAPKQEFELEEPETEEPHE